MKTKLFLVVQFILVIWFCADLKAQTWNERPIYSMKTVYEQDFAKNQWDGNKFYNQWTAIQSNIFTANDIANGYLQYGWIEKRILRSKVNYSSPYVFEAKIAYGTGSNYGGLVVRAVGNTNGEGVQEPADTGGGDGFNTEGIAFYPTTTGDSLIVQFTGAFVIHNTLVTRIKVPKPVGVSNFKDVNTFRIEDMDSTIYVFVNNNPFVKIKLADKSGTNFTTGSVYNAKMELVGSFSNRLVKDVGYVAICQRVATLRLYTAKIQVVDLKTQTISIDPVGIKTTENLPFKIKTSASSGLPVSLSLVSGPAILVNDSVKLTGKVGVVNILVRQAGNTEYLPVSMNMSFLVTKTAKLNSAIPVTGLLICCRGGGEYDRGTFLINGQWNAGHDYRDINQVRSILTHIQNAGINIVCIDMSNPSQWTRLWDTFSPMCENIRTVCNEKNMEYFILIGAIVSDAVRNEPGMPAWIKTVGHLEFWNMQAKYIWENWATDSHYRTYGFDDNRKIINMFYPGELVFGSNGNGGLWAGTPAEQKSYLSKFYRGTHEYNQDFFDTPTDGWGYRDVQKNSDGKIRFVSPTSGLVPSSAVHISAEKWAERIDWAAQAEHYSIYGSYDDNNDNIHWGINDTKNAAGMYKYLVDDPYYYYNVLKNKLTSSLEVSFVKPLNNNSFGLNANIDVEVNAKGEEGVSGVKLYINETLVSEDKESPYKWTPGNTLLANVTEGYYTLKAVATDAGGNITIAKIKITVGQPDKNPKVSFVKPLNNEIFKAPANVSVEVNATDEGSIAKVELYLNGALVSEDNLAPYLWGLRNAQITNMAAGTYTLKVVATDNTGNKGDTTINIVVSPAVAISEFSSAQNLFTVYPNPASHELNIRFSKAVLENTEIAIYNTIGEKVISQLISNSHSKINIKQLPAGVYILKIIHKDNHQLNRFIKN